MDTPNDVLKTCHELMYPLNLLTNFEVELMKLLK